MLNVKKLQAIRDKALGVTVNPTKYGDLNSVVYLQQILDAVQGVTSTPARVQGNLNEKIYLQKIRNAKRGVADGQFGSLSNSIYLQQIINACNGVTDGQFGSLSENTYLDMLVIAMSAGSAAWVPTYTLRDDFTTTEAAPMATPRTCEPGPGAFDLVDTTNKMSIVTGSIVIATGPTTGDPRITSRARQNRAAGRAISARCAIGNDGSVEFLFGYSSTSNGGTLTYRLYRQTSNKYAAWQGGMNGDGCFTAPLNLSDTLALVMRSTGMLYLIKRSSVWYIAWPGANGTENMYPTYTRWLGTNLVVDNFHGADLPTPFTDDWGLATARTASAGVGATIAQVADAIVEATWQAATGVTYELSVRRTDNNNRWIIRCDQGGSTIKIIERNLGVETERASAAQTWTNATSYRIVVLTEANSISTWVATVGSNAAAKASYTSAAFNNTATGVLTSAAVTNLASWPRVLTGTPATILNALDA